MNQSSFIPFICIYHLLVLAPKGLGGEKSTFLDSRSSHFGEWGKTVNKVRWFIPDGGGRGNVFWMIHGGGDTEAKPWEMGKNPPNT